MPLNMPDTDKQVGKCGMPTDDPSSLRPCDKPGVSRVAVSVAGDNDDYSYQYSSEFRAASYGEVMVDLCEEHDAELRQDFNAANARVIEREAKEAVAAEKIHELEDQLREAKAAYPGLWRG